MHRIPSLALLLGLALAVSACNRSAPELTIPAGSEVTLERQDGVEVRGRLVEVTPDLIVVETAQGRTPVARRDVRRMSAVAVTNERAGDAVETGAVGTAGDTAEAERAEGDPDPGGAGPLARAFKREPAFREVTIPAGTVLAASLQSPLASDEAPTETPVRATLRKPVLIDGIEALPAGTTLHGRVTNAAQSGRVKGRASVSFRFTGIDTPAGTRAQVTSAPIIRVAPATKKKDAAKIGAGAAGGAIVGGLLGGGDGAAKGAAAGGAAGTGLVLATRGEEVRLRAGTPLSVRLTSPLTVRVPIEP